MYEENTILKDASEYVAGLFRDQLSSDHVYHNYQHTFDTVATCYQISQAYPQITKDEMEILLLAAWFHDSGYVYSYKDHEQKSKEIARIFLEKKNYESNKITSVLNCIDHTCKNSSPSELITQIIADANIADIGRETYKAKASLIQLELTKFGKVFDSELDWVNMQLEFIESHPFHTEEANRLFGEQLLNNIQKLRKKKKKLKKKNSNKKEKIKDPRRGIQTMFRSIYRSHINLSSIADGKANMMIRVNSMIISITLTLVGAKFSFLGTSFKENQVIIFPIITLLFTGLIAIIFAILSAKPSITHIVHNPEDMQNKNASILFFGNFSGIKLNDYKTGMKELIKSKDDVYESMMTDLYFLGHVLTKKYRLIKISYIVFMTGLILTALITIYIIIHLKKSAPILII